MNEVFVYGDHLEEGTHTVGAMPKRNRQMAKVTKADYIQQIQVKCNELHVLSFMLEMR